MNIFIRPLRIEDAYTSVHWRNDPEVFKYTGNKYDHEITIKSELNWISKVIQNVNEYRCAIIADGEYVGNIYLTNIKEKQAEYHIFLGNKEYWGKGVASNASRLIIEYGFKELGLSRINLNVDPENHSAISLYKHLGFKSCESEEYPKSKFIRMSITHTGIREK